MTIKDQYTHNVHSSTMTIVLLECSRFDHGHWIKNLCIFNSSNAMCAHGNSLTKSNVPHVVNKILENIILLMYYALTHGYLFFKWQFSMCQPLNNDQIPCGIMIFNVQKYLYFQCEFHQC
jgi:hypothetical protein